MQERTFAARPVVHTNSSDPMEIAASDPTLVVAQPLSFSKESTAHLVCPVYAYPHPKIVWYKDGIPLGESCCFLMSSFPRLIPVIIEASAKVAFHKNAVEISGLEDTDAGMYRSDF